MHEGYGKWNSVYVRVRRWAEQGVWDALLQTLVELELTDDWQHMLDSAVVRAHSQATGAKGGAHSEAFGRSRGGFTSKIHARCDNQGRPLGFVLTGGQVSDYKAVNAMLADRGYDSGSFRLHDGHRKHHVQFQKADVRVCICQSEKSETRYQ